MDITGGQLLFQLTGEFALAIEAQPGQVVIPFQGLQATVLIPAEGRLGRFRRVQQRAQQKGNHNGSHHPGRVCQHGDGVSFRPRW